MRKTILLLIILVNICWAQISISVGTTQHTIQGSLVCSYTMEPGDVEIYLHIQHDTLEYNFLISKNKVYTSRLQVLAPIHLLELPLTHVSEISLNGEGKKGGMLQISTHHFEKAIIHKYYNDKNIVSIDTSDNTQIFCASLNEASYWKWKISTLLKTPLPDKKVDVKNTPYIIPAIPIFYTEEVDKNNNVATRHYYYNIKNDSIFMYSLMDEDMYTGKCSGISIEKTSLKQISTKNMEVRKPNSTEYSILPEKDSYVVAIGTPGKFIVTDTFHTGNYKSEIQKAMMLIICSNKEMATAVYNKILKATH